MKPSHTLSILILYLCSISFVSPNNIDCENSAMRIETFDTCSYVNEGIIESSNKNLGIKSLAPYATAEFYPTDDAYLQGATRYNDNLIRLQQGYRTGYLKFNISGVSGTISKVELRMTINSDSGDGTVSVSNGNSSNWSETNLSTSNAPTAVSTLASRSSSGSGLHAYDLSVSNQQLYNGNLSLILKHTGTNDLAYASKEHATTTIRPKLVITYTPGSTNPPVAGSSEFSAGDDAYLQGSTRYNNNLIRLQQGYRTGYLKFNISGISGTITKAELQLTINSDSGDGTVTVYKGSNSNWNEGNLTTTNAPASQNALVTRSSSGSGLHTYDLDVSDPAIFSGTLSLVLKHTGSDDLAYASAEHTTSSIRPKLIITYSSSGGNSDTTPPTTPTALSTSNLTSTTVTLNWSGATDNVGVVGYKIHNGEDGPYSSDWTLLATTGNVNTQNLTGLLPSTYYYFSILAFDLAGNESGRRILAVETPGGGGIPLSTLVFTFDSAGNQISRKRPTESSTLKAEIPEEAVADEDAVIEEEEGDPFERSITIYPNPTRGDLAIIWDGEYNKLINNIVISDMGGRSIPVSYDEFYKEAKVDLSLYPTGVYLVTFDLHDGTSVTKKILKQ